MQPNDTIENGSSNLEEYVPPKSVDDNINLRRQRNVTKDNYRPHIKYGQDFKHYIDNVLNNKNFEVITENIPYYNRQIRIFKDQCNGQRLQLIVPRVMESIMFNYKDKLLEWEVPDARKKEVRDKKGMEMTNGNALSVREQNFKIYVDNLLNGTSIPFNTNATNVGKLRDFKVQIRAFLKEKKTGKPTTIWISNTSRNYLESLYSRLKDIKIPHGNSQQPDKAKITLDPDLTEIEKFRHYIFAVINNQEIKLSKDELKMTTKVRQFCRKLHDKTFTINTNITNDQMEVLNTYKEALYNVDWKSIPSRSGGNTNATRTEELNKQRSQKMKEYWEKKRANGDTKRKPDEISDTNLDESNKKTVSDMSAAHTPEANAKRRESLKQYWANKRTAKLNTTPVTNTLDDLITEALKIAESSGIYLERKTLESPQGCIKYISDLIHVNEKLNKEIDRLKLQTEQENVQLHSQQEITIKQLKATNAELEAEIKAYNKINSMNTTTGNFEHFMQIIKNSGCKQFHMEF